MLMLALSGLFYRIIMQCGCLLGWTGLAMPAWSMRQPTTKNHISCLPQRSLYRWSLISSIIIISSTCFRSIASIEIINLVGSIFCSRVDAKDSCRGFVGAGPAWQPIMFEDLMIFVEELRMEQSVVLWFHAHRLKSFEGVSFINFLNWTDIWLFFVSEGSQKLRVESFVDMGTNHLIPRFLFGWDTIREGFFLSPEYGFWKDFRLDNLEGSSDEELFHSFSRRNGEFGINFVVKINEILIEERNSRLKTEMRDIPIDSQAIIKMDLLNQSISILFSFFSAGS